ncbi:MAG: DUF5060 domain-containing protein [Bryobacteraceae bacterium]|nr:DUF5060 domain-containing protein [Bryobacteraceae bacterium]
MRALAFLVVLLAAQAAAQTCGPVAIFEPCELVFELSPEELQSHANPYLTVNLQGEFRSPDYRTYLMPAFYDGGNKVVIRFTPVEPGQWVFRLTSNIDRWNGKQGNFDATASDAPGFVVARNVHHWAHMRNNVPHLWMGDTNYRFAFIDRPLFEAIVNKRAEQKFNHLRGVLIGFDPDDRKAVPSPDTLNYEFFREVDSRVRYMNGKGITFDLVLAGDQNRLADLFPTWQARERFIRYVCARYSGFNIVWQGVQEFEEYKDPRGLLREIGGLLKKFDPYQHPRSTHAVVTSSPLMGDDWQNYITYQSSSDDVGAIEHQLYAVPFVNAEFAYEDSGAGKSHAHHVDAATFRRRLWNATMNGQYPTYGNTGTYGGRKFGVDAKYLDAPGARAMTVWFDFFSKTRHWELEPYFDVDGGRALALPGIEYIVYVEKPGTLEVLTEKHSYDVAWVNPETGERVPQKEWKGERWTGEPPSKDRDWVLHLSREGRKEGMLRSYKFESRPILMQEVDVGRAPYEIARPGEEAIPAGVPVPFEVKLKRETRASRRMMYLWTAEIPGDPRGFRVLATGAQGEFRVPIDWLGDKPDGVLSVRLTGMNAVGKVYAIDRVFTVKR